MKEALNDLMQMVAFLFNFVGHILLFLVTYWLGAWIGHLFITTLP